VFGDPTTVVGFPTINVTDSVQGALGSASDDKTFEYTDDFVCPPVGEAYQNGVYAHSFPNTATIDETGQSDNANVDIRCSYEVPGRIIVRKITLPAGAPAESFRFDPSWGADFSLANGGSADSGLLPPAVYSVAELLSAGQIDAGWSLTSATCSDGSLPSAIGLSPQETVTCTFVNTFEQTEGPKGSLTIIKVATPLLAGGATQFPFASSLGNFSLADGDSEAFTELDPGAYLVSETLPASANEDAVWKFDAIECTAGSFSVDEDNYSVTVNLAEGEAAVCTFYNHEEKILGPTGSLTIVKQTVPEGGEGFEFDAGDLGTFTLDDDGSVVFNDLEAGAYTVIEFAAEGWAFAQVECTALDWSQSGASVTVYLE